MKHALGLCFAFACSTGGEVTTPVVHTTMDPYQERREDMVRLQLETRDISDPRVLQAMRTIPRERFVPEPLRQHAYEDRPLPIGHNVTISQPYIVALMTDLAQIQPGDRVLEIGTGSAYQSAILAELGAEVWTIEIIEPLATEARKLLDEFPWAARVHSRHGDGFAGWPEAAPFDAILVTAAPPHVPDALVDQLKEGGKMVIPVGQRFDQDLMIVSRDNGRISSQTVIPVAFVPMVTDPPDRP